jgi:hypothetical protein
MPDSTPDSALVPDVSSVPESSGAPVADGALRAAPGTENAGLVPTPAGLAALEAARALARQAAAPATLRAYRSDWTHYAAWCAENGFTPVPADPATVGAYLTSLADSHAPTTIRRGLAANACHQRAHEALDVPAEARRGRWPVIDAHTMLLAAPLEGSRMEFGSVIEGQ